MKRFAVFAVHKDRNGAAVWVRIGNAVTNRDDSINVHLDALPLDGRLHMREPTEPAPKPGEVIDG